MDRVRGPDAATLLVRAFRSQAARADVILHIRSIAARPWASATFVGTQHHLVVEAPSGAAMDRWIAALPDAQWTVRGHLVADLVVDAVTIDGDTATLSMAVLTIEDN